MLQHSLIELLQFRKKTFTAYTEFFLKVINDQVWYSIMQLSSRAHFAFVESYNSLKEFMILKKKKL